MNLFQLGEFTLNSGRVSNWKVECDSLTDSDWECLAYLMSEAFGPFRSLEGIPTGGLKLALAMDKYKSHEGPHLVVDDVLTTGSSLLRAIDLYQQAARAANRASYVVGAVVFARGPLPMRVKALFHMPAPAWGK
jgi:orotate phosphoribosyltransferase